MFLMRVLFVCVAFAVFTGATSCPVEVMKQVVSKLNVSQLSVISSVLCILFLFLSNLTSVIKARAGTSFPGCLLFPRGTGRGDDLGTRLLRPPHTLTNKVDKEIWPP